MFHHLQFPAHDQPFKMQTYNPNGCFYPFRPRIELHKNVANRELAVNYLHGRVEISNPTVVAVLLLWRGVPYALCSRTNGLPPTLVCGQCVTQELLGGSCVHLFSGATGAALRSPDLKLGQVSQRYRESEG